MQLTADVLKPNVLSELLVSLDEWLSCCAMVAVNDADAGGSEAMDETRYVSAAQVGDQDAFRRLVERYQPTIVKQMRRFSRESVIVEELVHDVFVEVFESLPGFKGRSPFEHWLRKIAVRVGYRHWKLEAREKRRSESIRENLAILQTTTGSTEEAIDAFDELHAAFALLGPRDRLVLTLLYWDGHSVAEAAKLSGWTQSLVKVQAHRARKRLKKLLGEINER